MRSQGFSGGKVKNPDYEACMHAGKTGHAETVAVYYDPSKISYETLVVRILRQHGSDRVEQHREMMKAPNTVLLRFIKRMLRKK
jgi:peptide methionine sulfoxide reductase MsrA